MSYFTPSHPSQECGECRGCPASSYHRAKCAATMCEQDERDFQDETERRWLFEQDLERERVYLEGDSLP